MPNVDPFERVLAASRVRNVLLGPQRLTSPGEVVDHLLAVQTQELAFSRWSVGQRTGSPEESEVLAAIATGDVVRVHALRPTWHYVRGEDLRWAQALTAPRVLRASAGWYRNHGVDDAFLTSGRRVVERELAGANHKTRDELKGAVAGAGLSVEGQRMTVLMFDLEMKTVVCSGPMRGRHHTYALVDERIPPQAPVPAHEAAARLVQRYLRGHAPATLKDLRWWSGMTLAELGRAVEDLGDAVGGANVSGENYIWLSDSPPDDAVEDAGRYELLQVFDELFVGYSQTRGLLDPDGEFGSVLPIGFSKMMHVVTHGDRLVGRWRQDRRAKSLTLTFAIDRPLAPEDEDDLRLAAEAYGTFFGAATTELVLGASTL